MKQYIGTKIVNMKPMTRSAYNQFRGWVLPQNERGDDEGYLVEYLDGGEPNTKEYAGYVSWSPAAQAEAAYLPVTGLTFGLAVEAMRKGFKVARSGWNGKGMFVYLVPANPYPPSTEVAKQYFSDRLVPYNAYLAIKNTDETVSTWVPSINDCLAYDWQIA